MQPLLRGEEQRAVIKSLKDKPKSMKAGRNTPPISTPAPPGSPVAASDVGDSTDFPQQPGLLNDLTSLGIGKYMERQQLSKVDLDPQDYLGMRKKGKYRAIVDFNRTLTCKVTRSSLVRVSV